MRMESLLKLKKKYHKFEIKNLITISILPFFLSGCGFSGWAYRDSTDGTIYWDANRPCIIKDNREGEGYEVDGKGKPIINLEMTNALKK